MRFIICGSDKRIECMGDSRPKEEVPNCFDGCTSMDSCVMCGKYIPEGSLVCKECREAVDGYE